MIGVNDKDVHKQIRTMGIYKQEQDLTKRLAINHEIDIVVP
jgi:hypothetical protein